MDYLTFSKLFSSGYSHKVLVQLRREGSVSWYFNNDNRDIEWEGILYKAVPMNYRFPGARDGVPLGGVLEIDIDQQQTITNGESYGYELLKWFDEADDTAELEVVAIIKDGEITKIGQMTQRHGIVNWDGQKIVWNLGSDDRMNMQINPITFNSDALTG